MAFDAFLPDSSRPARRVLRDEVYDSLLELLVSGRLNPGDSLGIDSLAAQLQVSPTPVREALVQLESTGLVTRTALRGYKVAPPMSEDAIKQLFDARLLLEVEVIPHAMRHRTKLLPALHRIWEQHRNHTEIIRDSADGETSARELGAYVAADRAFHDAIFEATENAYFLQMARHISIHGQRLRQFVALQAVDAELATAEHREILDAIEDGDVERAKEAARTHILGVRRRTLDDISTTSARS